MRTSFEATAVFLVILVPGALYIWSFERMAGRWGIGVSDRVLRFIGASAIFHAVLAPVSYWLWTSTWPAVAAGRSHPLSLWLLTAAYAATPLAVGTAIGLATRGRASWARWVTGPDPAPRAWDYLFQGSGTAGSASSSSPEPGSAVPPPPTTAWGPLPLATPNSRTSSQPGVRTSNRRLASSSSSETEASESDQAGCSCAGRRSSTSSTSTREERQVAARIRNAVQRPGALAVRRLVTTAADDP